MNRLREIVRLSNEMPHHSDWQGQRRQGRKISIIHDDLRSDWMKLNGFNTGERFSVKALKDGKQFDGRDQSKWYSSDITEWELDHAWFCKRGRVTGCIVNEPYAERWERQVRSANGLVVHIPPNPYASFWNPGSTLFVVIMRADHPAPQWLVDQLDFNQ